MKYYILFTKKKQKESSSIKNNCIAKTRIMNKIQWIKIHKNYNVVFLYNYLFTL